MIIIRGKYFHGLASNFLVCKLSNIYVFRGIGKKSTGGSQTINFQSGSDYCFKEGVIIHEFIHAWGFWHEQSRPDRDSYVEILWDNIIPDKQYNFWKKTKSIEHGPYDGHSIMHYRRTAFTANGQDTIRVLVSLHSGMGKVLTFKSF